MEVILNNEKIETQASTLAAFIEENIPDTAGIAIAVGTKVIPRAEWADTTLCEGAVITLIRATRGG